MKEKHLSNAKLFESSIGSYQHQCKWTFLSLKKCQKRAGVGIQSSKLQSSKLQCLKLQCSKSFFLWQDSKREASKCQGSNL